MSQSDSPPAFVPPPPYNLEDIPVYVDWQISWGSGFDEEEIARAEHDEKKTVVALEPSRRYEPILSESVLLPASNLCDVENELLVDEGAPSECDVPRPALRAQKSIEDTQGQVLRHQCQTARLLTTVWPINAAYKNLIRLWHPKALGRSQDISPGALEKGLAISNVDSSTLKDYTPRSSTAVTGSDGSSRWLLGRANQPTSAWSRFTTLFARERQPKSYEVNVRSGMLATNRSVSKSGGYAPIVPGGPQRYPEMARFLDSDDSFMVYQRFGYLQARLLLEKQERLRILEAQLDALDKRQTSQPGDEDVLCTLDIDEEFTPARDELTMKVEVAFNEYADLLQKSQAMVAMNRPTSREYRSVDNSIGNEMPLLPDEMKSFYRKEDLILPIYLLFKLTEGGQTPHSNAMSVGVLLVFTLAFSAVINLFTRAQRHEILAASAAYCAVLVVFFQNVGINSTPGRATTEALSGAEDDR